MSRDWSCRWSQHYFPEPRPATGLLFIPRVIYERGGPRWDDTGSGKLLTPPPEFSGNPTSRGASRKKEVRILSCKHFVRTWKLFFTCRKVLRHGASGFTSHPKEGVLHIFIALKNLSPRRDLSLWPLGPVTGTLTLQQGGDFHVPYCCPADYKQNWHTSTNCSLLNDVFSETDYVASNERVISEYWIVKD
jgi:hypothetical protein